MEKITKRTHIVFILIVAIFGVVYESIYTTPSSHAQNNNISSPATKNMTSAAATAAKSMIYEDENETIMTSQNTSESAKLRVIVIFEVKEGKIQEALNNLISLSEIAKKREGNISYEIYTSIENPNELLLDQLWSNKAAFDKHYNSPEAYKDRQALSNLSVKLLENKTFTEISKLKP